MPAKKNTKTKARHIFKKETENLLPVDLTDPERLRIAQRMADAQERGIQLTDELDTFKKQKKAEIDTCAAAARAAGALLVAGYEQRQVRCTLVMDYKKGTAVETRDDTGAVIEERPLRDSEKQLLMDAIDKAATPKTAPPDKQSPASLPLDQDAPATPLEKKLCKTAVEIIRETQRASTSTLQRRLGVKYTTAARIMDLLEQAGCVGPPNGSDPRKILTLPTFKEKPAGSGTDKTG